VLEVSLMDGMYGHSRSSTMNTIETDEFAVEEKVAIETDEKPAIETEKPSVETEKPATETEEPAVETEKPFVETDEKPAVETEEMKPALVSEQPLAGSAPKREATEATDDESPHKKTKTADVETEMKTDTGVVPRMIAA
jgi:hypothetical protein